MGLDPQFADLDGDGELDLVNGRYSPAIVYWFRGLGKGKGFGPRAVLFDDTKDGTYSMTTANAADLDGDGDIDLVLGDTSGSVFWARNEGSAKAPKFTRREPLMVGEQPMKVCHKSDAIAVDWDGDGTLDVLVGDETTDVSFFRGRGDGKYEPGVSLFSHLRVDPGDKYAAAKAKLDPHRVIPGYRVRLATADWNDDGKLDLLIGNCESGPATGDGKQGPTIGHVYVLLRQ
ncbi:MAG TPA: VCBS repeat-containing protein [Planctomycetota bacterium]|nr:VCBS repeat-containing protein [Planctomycetota bacterium]